MQHDNYCQTILLYYYDKQFLFWEEIIPTPLKKKKIHDDNMNNISMPGKVRNFTNMLKHCQ